MKIKFIVDRFKEQDRKQLEFIKKVLQYKPNKVNQNAKFLRNFTLALIKQYNIKKEISPVIEHNLSFVPKKINLKFNIPQAPSPIKLNTKLEPLKKLEL